MILLYGDGIGKRVYFLIFSGSNFNVVGVSVSFTVTEDLTDLQAVKTCVIDGLSIHLIET